MGACWISPLNDQNEGSKSARNTRRKDSLCDSNSSHSSFRSIDDDISHDWSYRKNKSIEFYKVPQLHELSNFQIYGSSEQALVDKWDQLWQEIQEVKNYASLLENKLLSLNSKDNIMEKVLIFIDKGAITKSTSSKYQICIAQKLSSQLPQSKTIPDELQKTATVNIDNIIYPAKYMKIKSKEK